jgi:hypothetical protein
LKDGRVGDGPLGLEPGQEFQQQREVIRLNDLVELLWLGGLTPLE